MEEEKKLVPFRLCTLEDKFPWGTETWALADLGWCPVVRERIGQDQHPAGYGKRRLGTDARG